MEKQNRTSQIRIMDKRVSVRTFSKENLPADLLEKIRKIVTRERTGPFGSKHKMILIDTNDEALDEIGKMTSYGVIKGATIYFGGYSDPDDKSVMDFGYCFHEALLELTALDLGTCWLGGTFGRGFIARALSLPEGKVIPAISPVGIRLKKRTASEKLVRFIANSEKRKPSDQLFFDYSSETGLAPLPLDNTRTPLQTVLSTLRAAPSASNKQPWRIVRRRDCFHLYWDFNPRYNSFSGTFNIQALDMGIALYHLLKSAEELDLKWRVTETDPHIEGIPWRYTASLKQ